MPVKKELIILCEHASAYIPEEFSYLGLPKSVAESHIGFDPGALELSEYIAKYFACKLFSGKTSRLLIDLNRCKEDKDMIPTARCNVSVPANTDLSEEDIEARFEYYKTYHDEVSAYVKELTAQGIEPVIISIHSFAPEFFASTNNPTDIDCALLFNEDETLASCVFDSFKNTDYIVKKNEPYNLKEYKTGGVIEHGEKNNHPYLGFEFPYPLLINKEWREGIAKTLIKSFENFIQN